ncbi:uncharacterized protein BO80DRAFT_148375 [Aspergillus ibericus CBS 121593]|uniref:Secreted protein n=1 Tax=Aspergillus ibericus CBS 121593 TaxID=1448316 RepID=A0A395GTH5_9EURO|nr:hypothetical protein BO80DRAFT_148375 [Aspergillus ibericus CBS 121593]RAK98881.1 hypothetical protein BO80DRAFT_148375 [Aspergillus ibericus CBS 121593]
MMFTIVVNLAHSWVLWVHIPENHEPRSNRGEIRPVWVSVDGSMEGRSTPFGSKAIVLRTRVRLLRSPTKCTRVKPCHNNIIIMPPISSDQRWMTQPRITQRSNRYGVRSTGAETIHPCSDAVTVMAAGCSWGHLLLDIKNLTGRMSIRTFHVSGWL